MKRKAQGEVITTILIILLVLAAVVIAWQAIKGTVQRGATTITSQSGCVGLDLTIESARCTAGSAAISVSRGGDSVVGTILSVSASDGTGTGNSTTTLANLGQAIATVSNTNFAANDNLTISAGIQLTDGTFCAGSKAKMVC